ncbi:MAG: hypothetical protein ACFFC3_06785 [Candidatus Odinarchaeota archaeon]
MPPINIEQTTLIKFLPRLKINPLTTDVKRSDSHLTDTSYSLRMTPDFTIYIKETHCLRCGKRLVGNGNNPRIAILDMGRGRREFMLHRKRCKRCGEIKPDYSKIAPKYGNYHENYKHRARQHYMEGLNPAQIKKVFKIDFDIDISKSSIVKWINQATESLREVLRETPVPSSGYWGYDEIHMNIKGKKRYSINTVDMNTHFIPVAKVMPNMGRTTGMTVLKEGRKNAQLWINGIIKDCTTNLGGLFRTRSFKHIKQQNCLTHVKWIMSAHVKAFTGMSKQSRKPVPKKWQWLLARFYRVLDSGTETDIYIWIEIVRRTIERLTGEKINELHRALKQLESWLLKIIAHQRNPNIPDTNNMTEGFHKKYEYYRAFKTQMKSDGGAQRVLDYRVFGHNFRQFPIYINQYKLKYLRWRAYVREPGESAVMRGQGNHFKHMFRKLDGWYGKYIDVWNKYFAIKKE